MWLKIDSQPQCEANRVPLKILVCHSRASCYVRTRHGSDLPLCTVLPQRLFSLLYPSHGNEHPLDPRTGGRFGRLTNQGPLTEEKPKLDNARNLKGFYHIDPDGMEFKDTMKNARKKLEVHMESATLCKLRNTSVNSSLTAPKDQQEKTRD